MGNKGNLTVETALAFPMFLMLLVVLLYVLAAYIFPVEKNYTKDDNYMKRINLCDSVKRKAAVIEEIFE